MPYIPDKDNICLHCMKVENLGHHHPAHYPEPVAWLHCRDINLGGPNKGERRQCKAFEPRPGDARKLKILELFAGTRSIGKVAVARGHSVLSVDWDEKFDNIDLHADIGQLTAAEILERFGRPDVIWASPDCTTFSIAAVSKHRRINPETGEPEPVSEYAKVCDRVDQNVLKLIDELQPALYFIENPVGMMRKMPWMRGRPRYTVTYCQYGDTRMKPTDIWTNHPDPQFKPRCKNGDPCHEAAPRGSKTGTQGLKGSRDRSVIPAQLCEHIIDICERYILGEEDDSWLL